MLKILDREVGNRFSKEKKKKMSQKKKRGKSFEPFFGKKGVKMKRNQGEEGGVPYFSAEKGYDFLKGEG